MPLSQVFANSTQSEHRSGQSLITDLAFRAENLSSIQKQAVFGLLKYPCVALDFVTNGVPQEGFPPNSSSTDVHSGRRWPGPTHLPVSKVVRTNARKGATNTSYSNQWSCSTRCSPSLLTARRKFAGSLRSLRNTLLIWAGEILMHRSPEQLHPSDITRRLRCVRQSNCKDAWYSELTWRMVEYVA